MFVYNQVALLEGFDDVSLVFFGGVMGEDMEIVVCQE
jgi:uncharacterized protein YdeI (YjbR/CyaY-like superfamily)